MELDGEQSGGNRKQIEFGFKSEIHSSVSGDMCVGAMDSDTKGKNNVNEDGSHSNDYEHSII